MKTWQQGDCNIPPCVAIALSMLKTQHLFFSCPFAVHLWRHLSSVLVHNFQSLDDIWIALNKPWSDQCKVVVLSKIINTINAICQARNKVRFKDVKTHWKTAISSIILAVSFSISGNSTLKLCSNSILDFSVMKSFNVTLHHPKTHFTKEIFWHPPAMNWVKCNTDDTSGGGQELQIVVGSLGTIILSIWAVFP